MDSVTHSPGMISEACPRTGRDPFHSVLLLVIVVAGLVFRLYHISVPPVDSHNWRQTQTLMIARNFARHDMNLFRPEVDWRTTDRVLDRGIVGGTELALVPWLTAALYLVFGFAHWAGRVVPTLFSLVGLVYFHRLVGRFFGPLCATLSTLILSISPMYLFFGRIQMPESFAFAMSFAALYYYDRWLCSKTTSLFGAAVLTSVLMLLGKPQMGVMALPMFFLTLLRIGPKFFLEWKLYLFAALVGAPFLSYMWYTNKVLIAETGLSFAQPTLINLAVARTPSYHARIWGRILETVVGPFVSGLAVIGLVIPFRKRGGWLPYVWAAAAVLFFLVMPGGNSANDYYQMAILPPACILAGRGLAVTFRRRVLSPAGLSLLALIVWYDFRVVARLYLPGAETNEYACGQWINDNLPRDALILSSSPSPAVLYYADRTGWICWYEYYGRPIHFNRDLIGRVRRLGASAIAVPSCFHFDRSWDPADQYKDTRDFLYDSFYCHREPGFAVFLMDRPPDLSLPANGTLTFGRYDARKYLRGTWGPDLRAGNDGATFVAMTPEKEAGIRFAAEPGHTRLIVNMSSGVKDQTVTFILDGREAARQEFPDAWGRRFVMLTPLEKTPDNVHTLRFRAEKQNENKTALLLFSITAVGDASVSPPTTEVPSEISPPPPEPVSSMEWAFAKLPSSQWEWRFPGGAIAPRAEGAAYTGALGKESFVELRNVSLDTMKIAGIRVECFWRSPVDSIRRPVGRIVAFWSRPGDYEPGKWPYDNSRVARVHVADPGELFTLTGIFEGHPNWTGVIDNIALAISLPTPDSPEAASAISVEVVVESIAFIVR